ncbi:hypothetical protein GGF44_006740, partial [Coemansia sp. RSA 1694]
MADAAAPNGRGKASASVSRQADASPSRPQQPSQQQQQQRVDDSSSSSAITIAHGGHTLVHDTVATAKEGAKRSAKTRDTTIAHLPPAVAVSAIAPPAAEDDDESMDVDVPDTERDSQRHSAEPGGKTSATPNAMSTGANVRKVRLIDRPQFLRGHVSPVFLCAWSPASNNVLATGAGDGTARIWDVSRPKGDAEYSVVLRHDAMPGEARVDVTAIVWNTQGTMLATACFSGQMRVWTASGDLKFTLKQARQVPIIAMRWNHKGNLLLSACLDGSIALWDMQTGQLRQEYKGHTGSVLDVDWQDNSTFAS